MLGVDGNAGGSGFTTTVLVHVQLQNDVALGRDLRRDFELEVGLAKRQRRGAAGGGNLVRKLGALLNQRLDLVGGDNARAGDNLALAIGFQRRQFKVQEAVGRRIEDGHGKRCCRVGHAQR